MIRTEDFTVLGPARDYRPHGILTLVNWKRFPELAGNEPWQGRYYSGEIAGIAPHFQGEEDMVFLPDIIPNGSGLPLWRPWLAERLRAVLPARAATFIRAELRIRTWRRNLAEGAVLVMPTRVYGKEAIDRDALAAAYPEFSGPDAPPLRKAPRVFLRPDFVPSEPLFALSFLGLEMTVLAPELARALGPLDLVHSAFGRLSEFGFAHQPPLAHPTTPEQLATVVPDLLSIAKRADPSPEDKAKAEVLSLFRRIGRHHLSGNRESWSELVFTEAGYAVRSGLADSDAVNTEMINEDAAWRRLRAVGMERLGLYTFAEQAGARPEAIAGWYRDIWKNFL